jgi:hypothetical protein
MGEAALQTLIAKNNKSSKRIHHEEPPFKVSNLETKVGTYARLDHLR